MGRWVATEIFMGLHDERTDGGVAAATRGGGHRRAGGLEPLFPRAKMRRKTG